VETVVGMLLAVESILVVLIGPKVLAVRLRVRFDGNDVSGPCMEGAGTYVSICILKASPMVSEPFIKDGNLPYS